jgi:hypothetical protein
MPSPSHPPSFDHSNYVWRGAQVMKLLIVQFSPTSCKNFFFCFTQNFCVIKSLLLLTLEIFSQFAGAIKQMAAIKLFGSLLTSFTNIRVCWLKSESMVVLGRLQGKFFVPCLNAKTFHCICKRILPFLQSQTNTCIVAEVGRAFRFLWVRGEFGYCSFVSSQTGSEKLFAKLWNWESADVQDMWRGTVHFWVLQEVALDAGGEACIHPQISTKNVCIYWILVYLKINI